MSVFREAELKYLSGGLQLGRIATVGANGTPHVVPVGWIYNAARDTIDVGGRELERSKKFRDVARSGRAAIVIDLADVMFMDSTALGVLVGVRRSLDVGTRLAVVCTHPGVLNIFQISGLDGAFDIFATRDEALAHVRGEGPRA